MSGAAKNTNGHYIEVGYEDKVIFQRESKTKGRPDVLATWQRSQGLWIDHPVFQGMNTKDVIDWLRGEDCEV
jgi:hypothetical protein